MSLKDVLFLAKMHLNHKIYHVKRVDSNVYVALTGDLQYRFSVVDKVIINVEITKMK